VVWKKSVIIAVLVCSCASSGLALDITKAYIVKASAYRDSASTALSYSSTAVRPAYVRWSVEVVFTHGSAAFGDQGMVLWYYAKLDCTAESSPSWGTAGMALLQQFTLTTAQSSVYGTVVVPGNDMADSWKGLGVQDINAIISDTGPTGTHFNATQGTGVNDLVEIGKAIEYAIDHNGMRGFDSWRPVLESYASACAATSTWFPKNGIDSFFGSGGDPVLTPDAFASIRRCIAYYQENGAAATSGTTSGGTSTDENAFSAGTLSGTASWAPTYNFSLGTGTETTSSASGGSMGMDLGGNAFSFGSSTFGSLGSVSVPTGNTMTGTIHIPWLLAGNQTSEGFDFDWVMGAKDAFSGFASAYGVWVTVFRSIMLAGMLMTCFLWVWTTLRQL